MKVLLTNDDGFHATGIKVLKEIIIEAGIASEIWIAAPTSNCSGYGRSIGVRTATDVYQVGDTEFIVNSTPSTSAFLGLREITGKKPDLILSGINSGINIGNDIGYSGTIGAAAEGAMMNIPSIAISQEYDGRRGEINWINPQKFLKKIINMLLEVPFWNKSTIMNVNFPLIPAKGVKFTSQGEYMPSNKIEKKRNVSGSISYTVHRIAPDKGNRGCSDDSIKAIDDGYITITPLKLDMTDFDALESLTALYKDCTL
ncbi:5'/3'-nucleotidase SurE [Ehrlichia minasensis]|uniref:5'-nucleotidase SurE n=1 Tax=Ehrlichia minasensis TaxID=1242993 RepID=A0A4Q6I8Q2_9RICK|nr:5'/3'-nucleotidase SurE [Ehrlichia minasensis]RZB12367.1 5'/3'-nucleotidase SurE [Ehrlichia minasensis]CEI84686.1 5'-nucleotidase SurE (Nucleoside 5'-monophosphate phosphohydrolase) [Ehrlichia minasensis]